MNIPRFTKYRAPRPTSVAGRVLSFIDRERGCWTAAGVAEALRIHPRDASQALQRLVLIGSARVVKREPLGKAVKRVIYEPIDRKASV